MLDLSYRLTLLDRLPSILEDEKNFDSVLCDKYIDFEFIIFEEVLIAVDEEFAEFNSVRFDILSSIR